MHRIPMPRMSLVLVALGGALVLGQQVAGVTLDSGDSGPATMLTVPAANVAPVGSGHLFTADMSVEDAATPTLR